MIEIGEYVRTKRDGICKLLSQEIDGSGLWCGGVNKPFWLREDNVLKHSKNLIDLIEVGDIMEIFDVLFNDVVYMCNKEVIKALKEDIENGIQIKSIVTHEQFEAMKYKVEVN